MSRPGIKNVFEIVFVQIAIVFYSGAILALVVSGGALDAPPDANPWIYAVFYFIYLISAGLIIANHREFLSVTFGNPAILCLVGVALISTVWSVNTDVTLRRSIALTACTAFAFFLISRFTPRQLLSLFTIGFNLIAWLSLLFALLVPHFGVMQQDFPGAWRGVFFHKNSLGLIMVWSAAFNLISAFSLAGPRWIYIVHCAFAVFLVIMSESAGALVQLLLLPMPLIVIGVLRLSTKLSMAIMCLLISVVLVFCGVVFTEYAAIFGILGKDNTLTGRTYLWQMIWLAITDHFWLGYGYGAFWAGLDSPGSQVQAFSGWNMRSSHSGWLEIWLNLGALGATMIAYLFVRSAIAALRGLRELRPPEIYLPVTILSILFISNLIETELMRQNSVTWILFVVAVCLSHSQRSANYERSTQRVVRGARVK